MRASRATDNGEKTSGGSDQPAVNPKDIGKALLVLEAQRGDERAFEQLVASYTEALRYYVRGLLKTNDEVDDVLQETWLAAFRQLKRLRSARAFAPWLYRIARNRALRRLRKPKHLVPMTDEIEAAATESTDWEPSADDAKLVNACLTELPPHHREILTLRYVGEMTYEQLAETLECRVGTVRSRLFNAKQALRRRIEKQTGEPSK